MRDVMNYRKKPVTVEAIQFLGWRNAAEIADWSGAFYVPRGYDHPMRHDSEYDRSNMHINEDAREYLVIATLEGNHRADVGDWIIRGVEGEFYPCKPDIFDATYDEAEDPS